MRHTRVTLLEYLNNNNILYKEHSHRPLFTVKDSQKMRGIIEGGHTKNLFLKDKKKKFFLISCMEDKKIDLKKLRKPLNTNSLSFASDINLDEVLGLKPGAVSPFGLINDKNKIVNFFIDKDILEEISVNFHPLVNNFTINLSIDNFLNYIKIIKVNLNVLNLALYRLETQDGKFK